MNIEQRISNIEVATCPLLKFQHSLFNVRYSILFLIFIPFSFLLTSCHSGNKYSTETKAIDSLQALVQKADSSMKVIDTVKLKNYDTHIMEDLALLRANKIDSMSANSADVFRNYNNIHWSLSAISMRRTPLVTELEKSNAQLSHLSHDLKEGLIKDDSVKIYLGFEMQKAEELIEVSHKSINDFKNNMPLYSLISPQADSLVTLVKEHKKI